MYAGQVANFLGVLGSLFALSMESSSSSMQAGKMNRSASAKDAMKTKNKLFI